MKKQKENYTTTYVLRPTTKPAGLAVRQPIYAFQQQLEAILVRMNS